MSGVLGGLKVLVAAAVAFIAAGLFAGVVLGFGSGLAGVQLPGIVVAVVGLVVSLAASGWTASEVAS